jgi:cytochrome c-type biogenesis protein CcmH/NrfG
VSAPDEGRIPRGLIAAVLVTGLLVVYLVAVADRGVALIGSGQPIGIVLGLAVLVLPALGIVLIGREWWLAHNVQQMADELAARGDFGAEPAREPRKLERDVADAEFEQVRAEVEQNPQDWVAWFRLGFAYDAARDRQRARQALRTAASLYRQAAASQ